MLGPVVAALRKRGLKARHECPGYVQIEGHDFVYAPSLEHWSHIHTKDTQGPWTRLMELEDKCSDPEWIANTIIEHMSAEAN
jgi:hypothetical protein